MSCDMVYVKHAAQALVYIPFIIDCIMWHASVFSFARHIASTMLRIGKQLFVIIIIIAN